MAKRFIDTGLFDDSWFMNLDQDGKVLFIYLITKCNHAGLIEYNKRLWELQTGINDLDRVIKLYGNRLQTVKENLLFIPKFLQYQYPGFPNSNVKAQKSAVDLLNFYNITLDNLTVNKPFVKGYDNDNDNGYDNGKTDTKERFLNQISWDETICMKKKISKPVFDKLKEDFVIDQELKAGFDKPIKEVNSHFINWMNGKLKDVKPKKEDIKKPRRVDYQCADPEADVARYKREMIIYNERINNE